MERYESNAFRQAAVGNKHHRTKAPAIRNDEIHWLNNHTTIAAELQFFQRLDNFIAYLNRTCFAGIRSYEFHYAVYEPGSFYKRHKDQFSIDDRRKYSLVMYLTEVWQPGDGGELAIYNGTRHLIQPLPGRIVFFSSELEHEVLAANQQRLSLTGWLKTM